MKFLFPLSACFFSSSQSQVINMNERNQVAAEEISQYVNVFSYNDLQVATNGFKSSNKIGEGGFGTVYKGVLGDGKKVAIKVLSTESKQGDREFMSEISSISNISHPNLVKLYGGCIDQGHRILVYEFLEHKSIAQALLGAEGKRVKFNWKARMKISLGIARGLAYIHEDVKPYIVHRDIKASNVLLDQNFNPKVSDFGLSKLFMDNITHITTRVAGTLGYLAPEYAISGHLTRKSDVYSFGALLLEIISGRSVIDFDLDLGEHYLVEKAWKMYKSDKLMELVDPVLKENFDKIEATRLIKIGLLCVQEIRRLRPHMSTVVKMMWGEINVDMVQIPQPGLLNNIGHVKIGRMSSSKSIMSTPSPKNFRF